MTSELVQLQQETVRMVQKGGSFFMQHRKDPKFSEISVMKSPGNFSTRMDHSIENLMLSSLKRSGLQATVLTEEKGVVNIGKDSGATVLIDPLDGSANFTKGHPMVAIGASIVVGDKVVFSVVLAPRLDDIYIADKNGAYKNGEPIHVTDKQDHVELIGVEWLARFNTYATTMTRIPGFKVRYGGSVLYDYALVAEGTYSGTLTIEANQWDIAPAFIAEKGGAIVRNEYNKPWNIKDHVIIAAKNERIFNLMYPPVLTDLGLQVSTQNLGEL